MVHAQGINGTGIRIAILDTGIDYDHEDLNDNYKGGIGFVQDPQGNVDPGNYDDSSSSHGTHVAGIIAAENNGIGVVGVAPNAEIYSVKVLDGAGFGLSSWIVSGIQWAVDNNMDIATISIQSTEDSQALHNAIDNAYDSGVLLVAAGGNANGGSVRYPAAYDSVIAVTATDADDHLARFSPIGQEIELAAPGVGIYSTIRGGYGIMDGTSMAAPHVTGVAALILSSDFQDVNGDGVRNNNDVRILLHNAIDLGDPGRDNLYGYGLADAQMAVMEISGTRELTLTRTYSPPKNNAGYVELLTGNYSVLMQNINLSHINMEVYENGVIRNDLSSRYNFKKSNMPQNICVDLNVSDMLEIVFIPYGVRGSTGYVTIRG
ncbi:MAG: S8 family peptidase [ANME-2 cluster archaeon]|nr:S8 family peptidase [ANME-2 cluster archaeon]